MTIALNHDFDGWLRSTGYREDKRLLLFRVFNGSFAVLMVIVVVVFLIYGVEVFVKIRGAFLANMGPHTLGNHVPDRYGPHRDEDQKQFEQQP